MRRSMRRPVKEEEDVPPPQPDEEEGITSQEEDAEFDDVDEVDDDDEEGVEGVEFEEDEVDEETEEGLEPNWEGDKGEDDEDDMEDEEAGSMSPTDALMETISEEVKSNVPQKDPICYHCGVLLVEPPLRLASEDASVTSPKISIPLHCEVCVRGIHSQCHISLGGSLPTQEESFICFHCRTSQHGKYEMKAADRVKVSVGPAHQVPILPAMFFEAPPLNVARNRFVQVWSADAAKTVIPDEREIHQYLQKAAQAWPDRLRVNSTGGTLAAGSVRRLYLPARASAAAGSGSNLNHYWCPFSPEYAMTILHKSNYNSEKALQIIRSPLLRDCFTAVCFPPTKPYYNKWKPKDRRWRMMKIPYPPSRIEAPLMDAGNSNIYANAYGGGADGEGPRLRSRRFYNYY